MKPRSAAIFAVVLLGLQLPAFADSARSDMALVIAVDVSGSVDDDRFETATGVHRGSVGERRLLGGNRERG
jgi:hypothetical protein